MQGQILVLVGRFRLYVNHAGADISSRRQVQVVLMSWNYSTARKRDLEDLHV